MHLCVTCEKLRPDSAFPVRWLRKGAENLRCSHCFGTVPTTKFCSGCEEEKDVLSFSKTQRSLAVDARCKACVEQDMQDPPETFDDQGGSDGPHDDNDDHAPQTSTRHDGRSEAARKSFRATVPVVHVESIGASSRGAARESPQPLDPHFASRRAGGFESGSADRSRGGRSRRRGGSVGWGQRSRERHVERHDYYASRHAHAGDAFPRYSSRRSRSPHREYRDDRSYHPHRRSPPRPLANRYSPDRRYQQNYSQSAYDDPRHHQSSFESRGLPLDLPATHDSKSPLLSASIDVKPEPEHDNYMLPSNAIKVENNQNYTHDIKPDPYQYDYVKRDPYDSCIKPESHNYHDVKNESKEWYSHVKNENEYYSGRIKAEVKHEYFHNENHYATKRENSYSNCRCDSRGEQSYHYSNNA